MNNIIRNKIVNIYMSGERENLIGSNQKILNSVDRRLLRSKLKKENIEISDEDFNMVYDTYNRIIDYCLENDNNSLSDRFTFAAIPKAIYVKDDSSFYCIFHTLIKMQKCNILHYLDYLLITYDFDWSSSDKVSEIYSVLNILLSYYEDNESKDDFIYDYINHNGVLLEYTLDHHLDIIIESKFIPREYKDIVYLYNEVFNLYLADVEIDEEEFFQEFLNMTYYYFLINNMFNREPQEIIKFLNYIKEDIPGVCDILSLNGDMEYIDRIKYIDTLYNCRNKVKIIK